MAAELGESFHVRKPYKISGKNKQFKGIVAHSWADFKSAACSSLQISTGHDAKVFLEEDLTEVDNEEYFQFLPAQTKFIILQPWETIGFGQYITVELHFHFLILATQRKLVSAQSAFHLKSTPEITPTYVKKQ